MPLVLLASSVLRLEHTFKSLEYKLLLESSIVKLQNDATSISSEILLVLNHSHCWEKGEGMTRGKRILAKMIPSWLLVIALITCGATAAGTTLLENTASSTLLKLLLDPTGFQLNVITIAVIAIFTGVAASAIVVGFFSAANLELVGMGTFTIFFVGLIWDFLAVVARVNSTNPVFGVILMSPLLVIYVLALIEYWRGITT